MTQDRVVVPPDAFVRKTGQLWKLIVATIVLPLGMVAVVLWVMNAGLDRTIAQLLTLLALVTAAIGLIVMVLASVSCPKCRKRLFWGVFTDPDSNSAITTFLSRRDCPACGHVP